MKFSCTPPDLNQEKRGMVQIEVKVLQENIMKQYQMLAGI
jgi:hypothetical protein